MNPPRSKQTLGNAGEGHARRLLETLGYVFITANWRRPTGEIDLVMRDGDELVFVEVKTRRGEAHGIAEEAVTSRKGQRLLATGAAFVAEHPEWHDVIWRIDIVGITLDTRGRVVRVAHIPNAVTGS